jgi:hypothetical protein
MRAVFKGSNVSECDEPSTSGEPCAQQQQTRGNALPPLGALGAAALLLLSSSEAGPAFAAAEQLAPTNPFSGVTANRWAVCYHWLC